MAKKRRNQENTDPILFERVTATDLARLYGLDLSTISKWFSRDGCPRNPDKTYSLGAVIRWREKRIEDAAADAVSPNASPELERWRKNRADMSELELRERRGELIELAEVEAGRVARIQCLKSSLLSMPVRLAPQLVGMGERDIREMLQSTIEGQIREFAGQTTTPDERKKR